MNNTFKCCSAHDVADACNEILGQVLRLRKLLALNRGNNSLGKDGSSMLGRRKHTGLPPVCDHKYTVVRTGYYKEGGKEIRTRKTVCKRCDNVLGIETKGI